VRPLEYAHRFPRVVHSDIKPSNIMLSAAGAIKIADFGIARNLSDSMSMLTRERSPSGTLVYMSPQQLDGERASHLDDIYSLGATLYDLLTSKPPFYRGQIDRQIRERLPPTLQSRREEFDIVIDEVIPAAWEQTIAACLAKDPSQRPQSALEVARRLQPSESQQRPAYQRAAPPAAITVPDLPASTPRSPISAATKITIITVALLIFAGAALFLAKRFQTPARDVSLQASASPAAPAPEQSPSLSPVATPTATVLATAPDGIPDGSTFGIAEVTATKTPDAGAETNMQLKIAISARANTPVDHTKVKIQVFFYDTINDKEVVLTTADVSYQWLTPHHDWKETNPEVLAVTYLLPKNNTSPALSPPGTPKKNTTAKKDALTEVGPRKYLGYIIRIYYNEQLQAVRADPTKLLNLFPPPLTAPH
jgi:serine/threonine protein kinase